MSLIRCNSRGKSSSAVRSLALFENLRVRFHLFVQKRLQRRLPGRGGEGLRVVAAAETPVQLVGNERHDVVAVQADRADRDALTAVPFEQRQRHHVEA